MKPFWVLLLLSAALLLLTLPAWQGAYAPFDRSLLQAVVGWGNPSLDAILLTFSTLGSMNVILPLCGLAVLGMLWRRRWREAILLGTTPLAYPLYIALKALFQRPAPTSEVVRQLFDRPMGYFLEGLLRQQVAQMPQAGVSVPVAGGTVTPQVIVRTMESGFPSGHALVSIVFFGLIALLAWRYLRSPWLRYGVVVACAVLIFAVGFSRVYMGRHYPSDVLAAWVMGGLWLLAASHVLYRAVTVRRARTISSG